MWDPQQLTAKVLSQSGRPATAFARSLFERLQAARPEAARVLRTQYHYLAVAVAVPDVLPDVRLAVGLGVARGVSGGGLPFW